MKKILFGVLLIICLVVALLPVTALADSTAKILIMGSVELSVTEGGAPAYTKNKSFDAANTPVGDSTFTAWTQESCDGTGSWNVKFEWPAGGIPTVTLKDAKFDYYDNDWETYAYIDNGGDYISTANRTTSDLEQGGETENNLLVAAIMPVKDSIIDLKVVLKGNNLVETGSGFVFSNVAIKANAYEQNNGTYNNTYFKDLYFEGEGANNTIANCEGIGIHTRNGYNVSFKNANLTLSTTATGTNAIPLHVTGGKLAIDGGSINVTQSDRVAIWTQNSGDIIINDGTVSVTGSVGKAPTNGVLQSAGMLIINGGTVNAKPQKAVGIYAKSGIEVNGGAVNVVSPYYGINAGGDIVFNGGTTTVTAQNAFYSGNSIAFGPDVEAYAGINKKSCQAFDGSNTNLAKKPWMLITDDENQKIEFDDEDDLLTPTNPSAPAVSPTPSRVTRPTTSSQNTENTYATLPDNTATEPTTVGRPGVSNVTTPIGPTLPTHSINGITIPTKPVANEIPTESKAPAGTKKPAATENIATPDAPNATTTPEGTGVDSTDATAPKAPVKTNKGPNFALIIVLIVGVLAVGGGVAAYFLVFRKKEA